jgi:hypothetical protein
MTHLQDRHGMDVRVLEVTCPLCEEFTSGDFDVLSLHIARHMEEIALAILPSSVDPDQESADDSSNHSDSSNGHEKTSYASLEEFDPSWKQFKYSRDGVIKQYTLRTDVGSVDVERLPHGFKIENCLYPRALVPGDQYNGSDLNKEKKQNALGWALAELNPFLQGHTEVLHEILNSISGRSRTNEGDIQETQKQENEHLLSIKGSSGQGTCDECRRRKTACNIREGADPCERCKIHKRDCTSTQTPRAQGTLLVDGEETTERSDSIPLSTSFISPSQDIAVSITEGESRPNIQPRDGDAFTRHIFDRHL